VHSFLSVRGAINAAYDRSLYASALAISERITLAESGPAVDIPPLALEVLDTASQERLFYRVGYHRGADTDAFITGYADLPRPSPAAGGGPVYYDATYRGDPVRVSALETRFPTSPPLVVQVLVAETVGGRGGRTRELVLRAALAQLAMIVVAAGILWVGLRRGLLPLDAVSRDVSERSAADLTPVPPEQVPRELMPVVLAVNDLMGRLRRTLSAQARFIADASHQLRTPLAVIQTRAELMLREEDPSAVIEAVADLYEHTQATTRLANQLLTLARAEPGQGGNASTLDLDALARETASAQVSSAFARGFDLGYEGSGPVFVFGREFLIRELLANLIHNALTYGSRGGTVTVSVARPEPGVALLAVEDDGPGIPAAERPRVLERFYRRPGASGGGAGLGLPIVAQIAEEHGARLSLLDGAGGRGLRVEIRFPEAPGPG
jgi:two-component system sensor histidine kinase TctE